MRASSGDRWLAKSREKRPCLASPASTSHGFCLLASSFVNFEASILRMTKPGRNGRVGGGCWLIQGQSGRSWACHLMQPKTALRWASFVCCSPPLQFLAFCCIANVIRGLPIYASLASPSTSSRAIPNTRTCTARGFRWPPLQNPLHAWNRRPRKSQSAGMGTRGAKQWLLSVLSPCASNGPHAWWLEEGGRANYCFCILSTRAFRAPQVDIMKNEWGEWHGCMSV